jgi:hypothetical protein
VEGSAERRRDAPRGALGHGLAALDEHRAQLRERVPQHGAAGALSGGAALLAAPHAVHVQRHQRDLRQPAEGPRGTRVSERRGWSEWNLSLFRPEALLGRNSSAAGCAESGCAPDRERRGPPLEEGAQFLQIIVAA